MSYREDFIKQMISQFFQALYKLMGLVRKKDWEGASEMVAHIRQELLGISETLANDLSSADLIRMLTSGEELNPAKPLILAELFKVQGDIKAVQGQEDESYIDYLKALDLQLEVAFQMNETSFPADFTQVDAMADLLEEFVLPADTLAALLHFYESAGEYARTLDTLFDLVEDSYNPAEALQAGFECIERLSEKSEEDLAKGGISLRELKDAIQELNEVKNGLN